MKNILTALLIAFAGLPVQAQNCPAIKVYASSFEIPEGDILVFIAEVTPASESVTHNWSISNGTIASGQGTKTIQVITDSLGGSSITATVEIGGLPRDCIITSSMTADVMKGPEKIISANYTTPQALSAAVKKFITQTDLANISLSQTAFVYVYGGAATTTAQLKAMNSAIAKEFEKNGTFIFQYKITDGGKKKIASFEMYRLMSGTREPKPSK